MKTVIHIFLCICTAMTLVACGQTETYVAAPPTPELEDFHVIDSYGDSTAQNTGFESAIDPHLNNGLFEIYWYANSFYDYWVTIAINDSPSMSESIVLSTEWCGANYSCDYDGMQVCEYSLDFKMGCGADLFEAHHNQTDIEPLLYSIPEYLYLNIEICDKDGWSCELISRPITLY